VPGEPSVEVNKRTEVTMDDVVTGLLAEGREDGTPSSSKARRSGGPRMPVS
jgi:hypothetical protein